MKAQKHTNVYFSLRSREWTCQNRGRNDFRVLRTLICNTDREFKKVWTKKSTKSFHFEGGRLFSENYRICHYGYSPSGGPRQMWMLPQIDRYIQTVPAKLEDALLYTCYHKEFPKYENKAEFIAVMQRDMGDSLVRYDLTTGQIRDYIFLSHSINFKYISWVEGNELFVIKSKHTAERSRFHMATGISMNIAIVMALFSTFPLKFVGMFEVDRRTFGSGITNAILSHSMLIVMYITGHVRFFSLSYILEKYKLFEHTLGESQTSIPIESSLMGQSGLPINIKITEQPPILFEVRCSDHDVQIGGFPWHYIMTPYRNLGTFHVYSLSDQKKARDGVLETVHLQAEPDRCVFHGDNSGRIVHISSPDIRFLELRTSGDDKREVREASVINLKQAVQEERVNMTSSGRTIRSRQSIDEIDSTHDLTIHQVDYEDELNLTWVSATHHHPEVRGVLRYHDNHSMELLREIELPESYDETYEHVVYVDLDTIVQVVKPHLGKFVCSIYRLAAREQHQPVIKGDLARRSHRVKRSQNR